MSNYEMFSWVDYLQEINKIARTNFELNKKKHDFWGVGRGGGRFVLVSSQKNVDSWGGGHWKSAVDISYRLEGIMVKRFEIEFDQLK